MANATSFQFKTVERKTAQNDVTRKVHIVAPLKNLSNFAEHLKYL